MSEWLELREDRAVREFDHRMNDALRMNHHFDPLHLDAEKPVRLDHFQSFIEESGGIDRDLRTHVPGRMFQRLLGSDRRRTRRWRFAKRSAGRGQRSTGVERRRERSRPSRHWKIALCSLSTGRTRTPFLRRRAHHRFTGHDQDFFARDRQIFARFDRRQRRSQSARSDDRDQHHVGIR